MSLCLAGGGVVAKLALAAFTLAWTHTIEKTAWEEDWRVQADGLVLVEARVQGSGAGMEPPADAVLKDGMWRWRPQAGAVPEVILRRAPEAGDWRICADGRCRPLGALLPPAADPVTLRACE